MSFSKGKISPNSLKGKSLYYLKQEMIIKTINTFSLGNTSILILDDKSSKIKDFRKELSDAVSSPSLRSEHRVCGQTLLNCVLLL